MASSDKRAITYQDHRGIIRTKNCGNAESVRECISWLKRQGYKLLDKQVVSEGRTSKSRRRDAKTKTKTKK